MEIRTSLNRFLSILLIVALGVAFFAGIQSSAPDMRVTEDAYFDDANLMDIRVMGTLGLTGEDLEAIAAVDGVEKVSGAYMEDVYSGEEESLSVLHFESFPEGMNEAALSSGTFPQKAGECFLDESYAADFKYEPGDVLEITVSDEENSTLIRREFTIAGIGYSPTYIAFTRGSTTLGTGSIAGFVYVLPEEFDTDIYSVAYVAVEGAKEELAYTEAYDERVEEVLGRIEEGADVRCDLRYEEVRREAEDEIADAEAEAESELSEAESELLEAESELADGKEELARARLDLSEAESEYEAGEAELEENSALLEDAELELTEGKDALDSGEEDYRDGLLEFLEEAYEGGKELKLAESGITSGQAQMEEGWEAYQAGLEESAAGEEQLNAAKEQLNLGQADYDEGLAELVGNQDSYNASAAEAQEGRAELDAAKEELAEGQSEYEQGRAELDAGWEAYDAAEAEVEAGLEEYAEALASSDELEAAWEQAEAEAENLQAQKDAVTAACLEQQSVVDQWSASVEEASALVASLQAQVIELQNQINNAGEGEDRSGLEAQLAAAEADLAAWESESGNRQAQLIAAQAYWNELRQEEAALAQGVEDAFVYAASLDAARAELASELEARQGEIAELEAAQAQLEETRAELEAGEAALAEAKAQLDEGTAQIGENEGTLAAGEEQLAAGAAQLEEGWAQLDAAASELDAGWQEVAAGEAELAEGNAALEEARAQLEQAQEELSAGQAEVEDGYDRIYAGYEELADARQELDDGWEEYESSQEEFLSGKQELEDGRKELEEGRQELEAAKEEVADGEQEIADNEETIRQGWIDYEDGKTEAEEKIADAREELENLEIPSWYVNDRSVLPDNTGYGENADRMTSIATIFPVLFFLIAALISLTTMTRMVEEERTQIGTLKALGYGKFDIARKYLNYAALATILGSILGVAVGEKLLPWVIITAYGIMYAYNPGILTPFQPGFGLLASLMAMVSTIGATLWACYRELQTVPAELMRPPSPKQGKRVFLERIPIIWSRLNFNWKSTVRNLLRYKSRFFMTVFGIGGCIGLLLVGFGLRDSIMDVVLLQYDELQTYDAMLILDTDAPAKERSEVEDAIEADARISASGSFFMQSVDIAQPDSKDSGKEWTIYIYVPEELEQVGTFLNFRDRTSGKEYALSDEGAIITEKIADEFGLSVGDTIALEREDGDPVEVPIAEICENYLQHYLYLTPALYEELYGEKPSWNSIFLKSEEDQQTLEQIGTDLLALDACLNISYTSALREEVEDMLSALNLVILVLIVSAGLLAFVVLYNLNNININERERELATLKVLGFYDMEVASYVYRENILLTILGAAAGCVIGQVMHAFIIKTVEVDMTMFGRQIYPRSFLLGTLLTVAFSVIVNFAMYFKLKKIDMVESLKSIE